MILFVFTESVGMIVESHPSLPPIDPSQPPPPGEETQTYSTSHIMPLMDVVSNVFSLIKTRIETNLKQGVLYGISIVLMISRTKLTSIGSALKNTRRYSSLNLLPKMIKRNWMFQARSLR